VEHRNRRRRFATSDRSAVVMTLHRTVTTAPAVVTIDQALIAWLLHQTRPDLVPGSPPNTRSECLEAIGASWGWDEPGSPRNGEKASSFAPTKADTGIWAASGQR
jgi:hypothetical protein